MADRDDHSFIAWDGERYGGAPPAGWYLAADNRWWPSQELIAAETTGTDLHPDPDSDGGGGAQVVARSARFERAGASPPGPTSPTAEEPPPPSSRMRPESWAPERSEPVSDRRWPTAEDNHFGRRGGGTGAQRDRSGTATTGQTGPGRASSPRSRGRRLRPRIVIPVAVFALFRLGSGAFDGSSETTEPLRTVDLVTTTALGSSGSPNLDVLSNGDLELTINHCGEGVVEVTATNLASEPMTFETLLFVRPSGDRLPEGSKITTIRPMIGPLRPGAEQPLTLTLPDDVVDLQSCNITQILVMNTYMG